MPEWKHIKESILFLRLLSIFFIAQDGIRPTKHYLEHHSDVDWNFVVSAIMCPSKSHRNKRYGKDRFTYIKRTKKRIVEVHVKEEDGIAWVINAFEMRK